jgi:hypothetical protein
MVCARRGRVERNTVPTRAPEESYGKLSYGNDVRQYRLSHLYQHHYYDFELIVDQANPSTSTYIQVPLYHLPTLSNDIPNSKSLCNYLQGTYCATGTCYHISHQPY